MLSERLALAAYVPMRNAQVIQNDSFCSAAMQYSSADASHGLDEDARTAN